MNNPDKKFWLDLEAICLWLNITKRQAIKVIDEHEIPKRNGLYDLASIVRIRNEVASF
jgi:predicted DNA-binding ribbon-helix-helix protein